MKISILITGSAGSGKSTTAKELSKMGYEAYDLENVDGMFGMYHKGTNKIFEDYENANPEHIRNAEWLCNIEKLKELIKTQKNDTAFYCGIASNTNDMIPFFTKFFVLELSKSQLNNRLKNREGTDDIGNNQEGRNVVLGWKDWWDNEMKKKGAIFIDASGNPEDVARKIITVLNNS